MYHGKPSDIGSIAELLRRRRVKAQMKPRCITCGHVNPEGAHFCGACGRLIDTPDRPIVKERGVVADAAHQADVAAIATIAIVALIAFFVWINLP